MNQLDALKQMTVVVADSGDIDSIRLFAVDQRKLEDLLTAEL